ncbi:MAG: MFS transporter [Bacteroides sp.]
MAVVEHTKRYATPGSLRFRRIRLGVLLLGLTMFAQLYIFQPILSTLREFYSIAHTAASLSVSAGTVGIALGLFFYVFYADTLARKRLMTLSMFVAAILTTITPLATNFNVLLVLNLLRGLSLSGTSAVTLAYLAEEIGAKDIGLAISLYISGNTIGGMSGRVLATLLTGWYGWQVMALSIGIACIVLSLLFYKVFPRSHNFTPSNIAPRIRFKRMRIFLTTPYFLALYFVGFTLLGVFVSLYNYMPFLLEAPPYSFPHYVVALIFLMYTLGIGGSLLFGRLSDRYPSQYLLISSLLLYIVGILTLFVHHIVFLLVGLALITFSSFGVHTVASRMVSTKAGIGKSSATCLYWLTYYTGSSVVGYATGFAYFHWGWEALLGVDLLLLVLSLCAALVFLRKRYVPTEEFYLPS